MDPEHSFLREEPVQFQGQKINVTGFEIQLKIHELIQHRRWDDFEASLSNNDNVRFIYVGGCSDLEVTQRNSIVLLINRYGEHECAYTRSYLMNIRPLTRSHFVL